MPKLDNEEQKDLASDISEQMDKKASDLADHLATADKKDLNQQVVDPACRKRMWRIVAVVAAIVVIAWVLYH